MITFFHKKYENCIKRNEKIIKIMSRSQFSRLPEELLQLILLKMNYTNI